MTSKSIIGIYPDAIQTKSGRRLRLTELEYRVNAAYEARKKQLRKSGWRLLSIRSFFRDGKKWRIEARSPLEEPKNVSKIWLCEQGGKLVKIPPPSGRIPKVGHHAYDLLVDYVSGSPKPKVMGPLTRLTRAVYDSWYLYPGDNEAKEIARIVPTIEVYRGVIPGEDRSTVANLWLLVCLIVKVSRTTSPRRTWNNIYELLRLLHPSVEKFLDEHDCLDPEVDTLFWWIKRYTQIRNKEVFAGPRYTVHVENPFIEEDSDASNWGRYSPREKFVSWLGNYLWSGEDRHSWVGRTMRVHGDFDPDRWLSLANRISKVGETNFKFEMGYSYSPEGDVPLTPIKEYGKPWTPTVGCEYAFVRSTVPFVVYHTVYRRDPSEGAQEFEFDPEREQMAIYPPTYDRLIVVPHYLMTPDVYVAAYNTSTVSCFSHWRFLTRTTSVAGRDRIVKYKDTMECFTPYPYVFHCETCKITANPNHSVRTQAMWRPKAQFPSSALRDPIDPMGELWGHVGHHVTLGPRRTRSLPPFNREETLGDYISRFALSGKHAVRASSATAFCYTCSKSVTFGTLTGNCASQVLSRGHNGHIVEFSDLPYQMVWREKSPEKRTWLGVKMGSFQARAPPTYFVPDEMAFRAYWNDSYYQPFPKASKDPLRREQLETRIRNVKSMTSVPVGCVEYGEDVSITMLDDRGAIVRIPPSPRFAYWWRRNWGMQDRITVQRVNGKGKPGRFSITYRPKGFYYGVDFSVAARSSFFCGIGESAHWQSPDFGLRMSMAQLLHDDSQLSIVIAIAKAYLTTGDRKSLASTSWGMMSLVY